MNEWNYKMQTKPLGCLTSMGISAAIITAAVIVGVAFIGGNALFSAGPLSVGSSQNGYGGVRNHADLSHDCDACHTSFWGEELMRDRCLMCHTQVREELNEPGTLHHGLDEPIACHGCHTEHKGTDAHITRYDTIQFPHSEVGFSLQSHQATGTWGGLDCLGCHEGTVRELKLRKCIDCHNQLAAGSMDEHVRVFSRSCLGCHDGYETYGKTFQHSQAKFPLEGTHQETPCEGCHLGDHDLEDLRQRPHDCNACHAAEDSHKGSLGLDCERCHTPLAWDPATFDHSETLFTLDGSHLGLACENCHADTDLMSISVECMSCHDNEDIHLGGLGNQCQICHQTTEWIDASFDHTVTEFQLEESHALLTCNDCHEGIPLSEISTTCYGCHSEEDAHASTYGEQCEACHRPTTWEDVTFDHALSMFPLTGSHVGLPCEQCHIGGKFEEIGSACASCHADPGYHKGLFSYTCESCHNTSTWRPATFNQSHRFPFNHGGRASGCATCHPNSLHYYTCYRCHEHDQAEIEEEHREEGIGNFSDCTRCHPTGREEEGGDD